MDQSVNMVFPCLIDLKNILPPSKGKPTSIYPIGGHQYRKTPTHWLRLQGTDGLGSSKYTNSSPGPYPSDQIAAKLGNQSPFPTTLGSRPWNLHSSTRNLGKQTPPSLILSRLKFHSQRPYPSNSRSVISPFGSKLAGYFRTNGNSYHDV